ncbi:MAG: 1-phosphofructokinase family hexose kinase [Spirochaetota bacterium]
MAQILTLTMNPAIDKSAHVDRVTADVKLRARDVRRDPGGGGINVSRAIAYLGGSSRTAYVCGGMEGEMLDDLLQVDAIEREPLRVAASIRENLTVTDESTETQYRFGMPGPELTAAEVRHIEKRVVELIDRDTILVASGSLPPGAPDDFYAGLARHAGDRGARIIVDTSGEALIRAIEAGVYLVKPNLHELGVILGEADLEGPRIREAAEELVASGRAEHVLVSLGSAGALLATRGATKQYGAPTVSVRSRIGAGDSMIGGIAWSLARGEDVDTATRWGIAAGAAAVMTPGTELCRGDDARRLFNEVAQTRTSGGG